MMGDGAITADRTFEAGGTNFLIDRGQGRARATSTTDRFVIGKSDKQLAYYRDLGKYRYRDILEIGMVEGGSLVLWDKWFAPHTLVGVERRAEPIAPLEAYLADKPHIHTFYGRSLGEEGTLTAARRCFSTGIDLVIHNAQPYNETKRVFETIFPLVRARGHYIIEDWGWAHHPTAQQAGHRWQDRPAMTNLLFELVVLAGSSAAIDSIHVDDGLIAIRRGPGKLPAGGLQVDGLLRGRSLPAI